MRYVKFALALAIGLVVCVFARVTPDATSTTKIENLTLKYETIPATSLALFTPSSVYIDNEGVTHAAPVDIGGSYIDNNGVMHAAPTTLSAFGDVGWNDRLPLPEPHISSNVL